MGSEKMGFGMQITLTGALCAYLIGAGFATGQETLQYYSCWGTVWAPVVVGFITFIMTYLAYVAYAYAGRTRELEDVSGVFRFYAGPELGKAFAACAWAFNASAYVFMVSGFGNTLSQQWGAPLAYGNLAAVIISVSTAMLGLNKMIDVIGKVGPLIIILTLIIAVISAFRFYPLVSAGNTAINNAEVNLSRAGSNVILSGLSYGGDCLLLVSAMVGRMGFRLRQYGFKYTRIILCVAAVALPFVNIVMAFNHIGNIHESSSAAIPNLTLANHIVGSISGVFAIFILLAIYTTLCPIIWTCTHMLAKDEKSLSYKIICVGAGAVVYFVTLLFPYQALLNYIMTYCGYSGAIVAAIVIFRFYVIKAKDQYRR
ncbi:hypothetical protein M3P05_12960 [Sansalvadorimonas sp. 2012CJ34-2]|uniref:APC family permease n=1 Tax=Parendozoicomonas callyspongiae TaxID=2942213 RepID=A0ABT0PHI9_9GAMM|nr:hypothetical protein [Sansalvadorimonas sp. 2012CJ34-2]MCL6270834.1 hypothetical protein [Sansalvadorimonas sp. 2012CJ34-2]